MVFNSSCTFKWHQAYILFLLYQNYTIATSRLVPYTKECASIVPEATPTSKTYVAFPFMREWNSFITGGERILGKNSSNISLYFRISANVYATKTNGIYKIEAKLTFAGYNLYQPLRYSTHPHTRSGVLKFLLHGFWSKFSGEGCVVGSAAWYSKGEPLNLEAMLKFNYSGRSTYSNSSVTGMLKSLSSSNDESYFEPIFILSFPSIIQYKYGLISEETISGFHIVDDIKKSSVLVSQPGEICSLFNIQYTTFKLEYATSCNSSLKNCSLQDGCFQYMPPYISLHAIQCHRSENRMRFLVQLTDKSFIKSEMLNPNKTLVGEGLWDEKTNRLLIVACSISNSVFQGGAHVGDCSFRLSLWYPSIWSVRYRFKAMGQIWRNKTAEDVQYFGRIEFRTSDEYMNIPGLMYKYTKIEKVRKLCPNMAVKRGERYPSGQSYDLRFDMFVPNSKYFGWSFAEPLFIGNKIYGDSSLRVSSSRWRRYSEFDVDVNDAVPDDIPLNVSYKLSLASTGDAKLEAGYSSLNQSLDSEGQLKISAEGVYDPRTGFLCMVGCRILDSNNLLDCEILLSFQFPRSNVSDGGFIKGSMKSTREHSDPLFFEHLNLTSSFLSDSEAQRSVWRIDLEITMVLISNTLACVFVCFQLYYVKRYPDTLAYMSLVMLVILTLGYMIPLVLNFGVLFMGKRNATLSSPGWLEVNEVFVRVVTMVAFLLQFRLLQLAWAARRSSQNNESISIAEKKTLLVSLPTYIVGAILALLVNWKKINDGNASHAPDYWEQHTLWGVLRSCAGLILDGFLFPQILLYIFQVSSESALSSTFYLGTTLVHSVPHAYDLYRTNNYVPVHVSGTYLYANPSTDFYSAAWDVIIPFVGLLFAAIIFLQQYYGSRFILPRKWKELESNSKCL